MDLGFFGLVMNVVFLFEMGFDLFCEIYFQDIFLWIDVFELDLILILVGFDVYVDDFLVQMNLVIFDFVWVMYGLCDLVDKYCGGCVVFVFEGGYNLSVFVVSVVVYVQVLKERG